MLTLFQRTKSSKKQEFNCFAERMPQVCSMARKKRLAWFFFGGVLGVASQLLFLVVFGDAVGFFRIYLVDVPTMYKFIWPRSA